MNRTRCATGWLYLALSIGFIAVVAPFVWMVLGSFKGEGEPRQVPPTWWPESPTLDNYRDLFDKQNFPRYFLNSTVEPVVVTAGNLVVCSMLGYALAKLNFPGKKVVFGLVMGTLMIPGMVTFVPLFVLVANLGMVDFLPGADPAVPGDAVRGVPDASVHRHPAGRSARRREGRRGG